MKRAHIKKGDTVAVISGADKGQKGKVLMVNPTDNRVLVEGANMVTRHVKPRGANEKGGRMEKEGWMYADKVMVICPSCKKATRHGYEIQKDGKKQRVCKKCGKKLES
jgi:large subunit ribosomal protein L24